MGGCHQCRFWAGGLLFAVMLFSALPSAAEPIYFYASVERMAKAPSVLIVDLPPSLPQPVSATDGVVLMPVYPATVTRDLRGGFRPGDQLEVRVRGMLEPGCRYLLIGEDPGPAQRLVFDWMLGVTKIPTGFDLATLEERALAAQITAILTARHDELARLQPEHPENGLLGALLGK